MVSSEGTLGETNGLPTGKPSSIAAIYKVVLRRELSRGKYRLTGPDSWGACQKDDFNDSRLLHLPICKKALNSLNWDIYFSLTVFCFVLFYVPDPCCKTLIYPDNLHYLFKAIPYSYLRGCVLGLSPQFSLSNKK